MASIAKSRGVLEGFDNLGYDGVLYVSGSARSTALSNRRHISLTPVIMRTMGEYTAIVQRSGDWWIGWIEEVPGVNCQEATREKLLETLRITLQEALNSNRAEARLAMTTDFEEIRIAV